MREHQDAYGRLILDHFEGRPSFEAVERDDGFLDVGVGPALYFEDASSSPVLDLVQGRVVDVGAGAGRFALALQDRGHAVVAIDNSPLAIEVCRRRGVRDARVLALAKFSGPADTILMMGNNLGLLGSFETGRKMLIRWRARATRIVGQTADPYRTDKPEHLAYHERNRRRGRASGQIRIRIRYRQYRTPWFDYLFVSPDELRELARGTGWRVVEIHEDGEPTYVAVLEWE